ncbi:restriction endonuclease subunit S [uncultured Gulosibacter sp.]|uniref:restriction endonuclease subunit S n=1 Tax=uncultured Gulosibacter sp. TaxID=1339167 RepID=UPI00288A2DC5|nr:restriction endonuclease subunit S [uncultured Gulosibacter sp.]
MTKNLVPITQFLTNFDAARVPVRAVDREPGTIPYLGASGTVDHVAGWTHEGDYLCISEDGENLRSRQTPIAWAQRGRFWANNHVHVLGGVSLERLRFFAAAVAVTDISGALTGSTQPKLTQRALDQILIPEFDASAQTAIGEVLGALDDKIAANLKLEQTSLEYLSARWETLTSTEVELVDWDSVIETSPRLPKPTSAPYTFLNMRDLPTGGFSPTEWETRDASSGTRFQNGDTLLARITPSLENGKLGFVDFLAPEEVGTGSTEYIVLRPRIGTPPVLPYLIARTNEFRSFAIPLMSGTSGRQRLQANSLFDYKIAWPKSNVDLDFFYQENESIRQRLTAARDENRVLARTRDELLPLLMNGTITVREAEDRTKEVL